MNDLFEFKNNNNFTKEITYSFNNSSDYYYKTKIDLSVNSPLTKYFNNVNLKKGEDILLRRYYIESNIKSFSSVNIWMKTNKNGTEKMYYMCQISNTAYNDYILRLKGEISINEIDPMKLRGSFTCLFTVPENLKYTEYTFVVDPISNSHKFSTPFECNGSKKFYNGDSEINVISLTFGVSENKIVPYCHTYFYDECKYNLPVCIGMGLDNDLGLQCRDSFPHLSNIEKSWLNTSRHSIFLLFNNCKITLYPDVAVNNY